MIDAYRIGVTIALKNDASSALRAIAADVLGLHGHVKMTEAAFGRMRLAMVGAAGVLGGTAVLGVFKDLVNAAKEFRVEQSRLMPAGFSAGGADRASKQAWAVATGTPGANLEHVLAHQREMREILGTEDAARQASPLMEKLGVALSSQTGMDVESSLKFLTKSVELQAQEKLFNKDGKFDGRIFADRMDAAFKFVVAANGFIKPEQMMGMLQQAGVGAQMGDFNQFWRNSLMAAIEQGGLRAGTGLAADFRTIENGVAGKDRQAAWVDAGLSHWVGEGRSRKAVVNDDGRKVLEGPGGVNDYVEKQLLPKVLAKLGYKAIEDKGALEAVRSWIQQNESVETARRSLSVLVNRVGMSKAQSNYDSTWGIEKTFAAQEANNPDLKIKAFGEAWHNLMVALGLPLIDGATDMITKATRTINSVAATMAAHPDAVRNIEVAVAALAGLVAIGGTIAIATTALGPFTAALRLLIGVAGAGGAGAAGAAGAAAGLEGLAGAVGGIGAATAPATMALAALVGPAGLIAAFGVALLGLPPLLKAVFGNGAGDPDHNLTGGAKGLNPTNRNRTPTREDLSGPRPSEYGGAGDGIYNWWLTQTRGKDYLPTDLGGGGKTIRVETTVNLDGRTVAKAVNHHNARGLGSASTGVTGFDGRVTPRQPGAGGLN